MYPKKPPPPLTVRKRAQTTQRSTSLYNTSSQYHRDQIKTLLINRFRVKYGAIKRPELDSAIKQEVESLMRREKVYQSHLETIEKRLKGLVTASNGQKKAATKGSAVPNGLNSSLIVPSAESKKLDPDSSTMLPSINKSQIISPTKNQWAKIIDYDLELYKADVKKALEVEQEKKKKIKAELDRQIQEKNQVRENIKKLEHEKDIALLKQAKKQEEAEALKIMEGKKKIMHAKSLCDQQLKGLCRTLLFFVIHKKKNMT